MALDTYANLQLALADWTNRADLTALIPDLITLFESKAKRRLRTRQMENDSPTFAIAGEFTALPSDFLQMRRIRLNTSPIASLEYVTPQAMDEQWLSQSVGQPQVFTIMGSNLRVRPIPDTSYTAYMTYYRFLALSVTNTTNWLLTAFPDAYLFGSLVAAEAYMKDDPRIQVWKSGIEEVLAEIESDDQANKQSGSALRMRSNLVDVNRT